MTRVLSGAVLLLLATAVVWFAPPLLFLAAAEALLLLAFAEYAGLARASGTPVSVWTAAAAAACTCAAFAQVLPGKPVSAQVVVVLMAAFLVLSTIAMAKWRGGRDALGSLAAGLFPAVYLGLPIGAMVAIRGRRGPEVLFLLMLTVFASDTAQYYTGRALGSRPLATAISPKKTVEGGNWRVRLRRCAAGCGRCLVAADRAARGTCGSRRRCRGVRNRWRPLRVDAQAQRGHEGQLIHDSWPRWCA